MRDSQKSKVYAWERAVVGPTFYGAAFGDREECERFIAEIWEAEHERYGQRKAPPAMKPGGRGARAYPKLHTISLGQWARNPWITIHELSHVLAGPKEHHGPRFVAILMGVAARALGYDIDYLIEQAEEKGVKYDRRSIGAVPAFTLAKKIEKALPGTAVELAVRLGVSYRQIHGAALSLIREGKAKWRGKTLAAYEKAECLEGEE